MTCNYTYDDLSMLARAAGYLFVTHTSYDDIDGIYTTCHWIREGYLPDGGLIDWNPYENTGDAFAMIMDVSLQMKGGNAFAICFADHDDSTVVVKDYVGIHVRRGGMFSNHIHEETRLAICDAVLQYAKMNNL